MNTKNLLDIVFDYNGLSYLSDIVCDYNGLSYLSDIVCDYNGLSYLLDIVFDYNGLQTLSSPYVTSFHITSKPITLYKFLLDVLLPVNTCFSSISAYFLKHHYWYYIYKDYLYVLDLLSTTYPYKCFTDSYPLCTRSPRHHIQPYLSWLCIYFIKFTKLLYILIYFYDLLKLS